MHQDYLAQHTDVTRVVLCPNIMAQLLKSALLARKANGTLAQMLELKAGDKFSPNGVICDVWGKVTGKGRWVHDAFNYETFVTGSWAWANTSAPLNAVQSFYNSKNITCPIFQFLANERLNNVDKFLEVFEEMKDFPAFVAVTVNEWQITGKVMHGGIITETVTKTIAAQTSIEAAQLFNKKHPNHVITDQKFVLPNRIYQTSLF